MALIRCIFSGRRAFFRSHNWKGDVMTKREFVDSRTDRRYIRRRGKRQFKESIDVNRVPVRRSAHKGED
jgi:hypothetical protein